MDIRLDALLNLPWVTIESCTIREQVIYLRLEVLKDTCECPHCGQANQEINQVRYRSVRDLSISGRTTYLEVPSRQFYCQRCQKYYTEKLEFVEPRRFYTQRYEQDIYQRVQQSSLTQVGREEGLKFDAVEGIFKHQYAKKKGKQRPSKKLSIDEFSHRKGRGQFATVVSDIETSELVEVIDSHEQEVIIEKLSELPLAWRQGVEEVSVDMWGGFPKVIQAVFPNAQVVIDRFHVMKAVIEDLNRVRRQSKTKVKGAKFILSKNAQDLTAEQQEKLNTILLGSKRLEKAYRLKEEFRQIYETQQTPAAARQQFQAWLKRAKRVFNQCVKTVRNHLEGICNYFVNRTTSGTMEGINNRIKLIKRQAYGFTVFEHLRQRLLACFSH